MGSRTVAARCESFPVVVMVVVILEMPRKKREAAKLHNFTLQILSVLILI